MRITTPSRGFTIIEVVLVLAIAALIFLMVFIALPALQRGQRDTQRRSDMQRVVAAIQKYKSLNKNKLPAFNDTFIDAYLRVGGDEFLDPMGKPYLFYPTQGAVPRNTQWQSSYRAHIYWRTGAECSDHPTSPVTTGKGASQVTIQHILESGPNCWDA